MHEPSGEGAQLLSSGVVRFRSHPSSRLLFAGEKSRRGRDWLTVCRLPPYAPQLNLVEPVWSHLKRSPANLAERTISELAVLIKTRLKRDAVPAQPRGRHPRQHRTRPHTLL